MTRGASRVQGHPPYNSAVAASARFASSGVHGSLTLAASATSER